MIAIKRRCKFFDRCHFADDTSRTCTYNAGGGYCGAYRTLSKLQKEKRREKKMEEVVEVEDIQDYLEQKGIIVSKTAIIKAAIEIARRRDGNAVFIGELKKEK
jgi:hypothetical protein